MQSERGLDIAYHLGKNPILAAKVAMLPPLQAVLEIGRIEGTLSSGKRVSDAHAPTPQVGSGSSLQKTTESMSMEEYVKARNKRIKGG